MGWGEGEGEGEGAGCEERNEESSPCLTLPRPTSTLHRTYTTPHHTTRHHPTPHTATRPQINRRDELIRALQDALGTINAERVRFQRACEDVESHHQDELQELKQHLAMALTSFQASNVQYAARTKQQATRNTPCTPTSTRTHPLARAATRYPLLTPSQRPRMATFMHTPRSTKHLSLAHPALYPNTPHAHAHALPSPPLTPSPLPRPPLGHQQELQRASEHRESEMREALRGAVERSSKFENEKAALLESMSDQKYVGLV